MKRTILVLFCMLLMLTPAAGYAEAAPEMSPEEMLALHPPMHEFVFDFIEESGFRDSLYFPSASQYGMNTGNDMEGRLRVMGGTEEMYARLIGMLEENGVVVESWYFLPDPDCGAMYVTIDNVRWGDVGELRDELEERLDVETSVHSFEAEKAASEAVITVRAANSGEAEDVIRILLPYYWDLGDDNITRPDSGDGSGKYIFRIPGIDSTALKRIKEEIGESAEAELVEAVIDNSDSGARGRLTLRLFAMTKMEYEEHMRTIDERAGFNYYGSYAYEPMEFRFEAEGGLGWLIAELKWPEADAYLAAAYPDTYEYHQEWERLTAGQADWERAAAGFDGSNAWLQDGAIYFPQTDGLKGYDQRCIDYMKRIGAQVVSDTTETVDDIEEAVECRVVGFDDAPFGYHAPFGLEPSLYVSGWEEPAEGIPDSWPLELAFPEGVGIISAGFDGEGRYVVDLEDDAWLEICGDYDFGGYMSFGDSYEFVYGEDGNRFRRRWIMLSNRLYGGAGSIIEIRAEKGCTEDIVMRFTER